MIFFFKTKKNIRIQKLDVNPKTGFSGCGFLGYTGLE
jgi:hypothetical protein